MESGFFHRDMVGKLVRVRDFEEMKKEFGTLGTRNINPDTENNYSFTEPMLQFCNDTFLVAEKVEDDPYFPDTDVYRLEDINGKRLNYYFHTWMFEEVEPIVFEPEYQIDFLFS